jgi:hypothetical protein
MVRDGILNSLAQFGHPQLVETEHGWSVCVGTEEAQTLFAFDQARLIKEPIGVVVFLRKSPSDIVIVHVAVHPDYALQAGKAGAGLGVTLIEKVMEIATRIVGVKRIVFFYRQQVVIQLSRSMTAQSIRREKVDG